jgi:histidinol dehydrogenase
MRILDVHTAKETILRRAAWDEIQAPPRVLDGIERLFGERLSPDEAVRRILADVRTEGAAALRRWTAMLDGVEPPALVVSRDQIQAAYDQVADRLFGQRRLFIYSVDEDVLNDFDG